MSSSQDSHPEETTPPPTPRYNLRNRTPHAQDRPERPRTRASLAALAPAPFSPNPSSSRTGTRSAAGKGGATSSKQNRRTRTLPKRKARPSAPAGSSVGRRLFDNIQTSTPASSRAPSESLSAADYNRTFTNLYQWPKPQLIEECRKQKLMTHGTKTQLRERLAAHLAENHVSYFESTEQIPKGATHDSTVQLQQERSEEQQNEKQPEKDEIVDDSIRNHDELLSEKASVAKNAEDVPEAALDETPENEEKQDNEQVDSTPMRTRSGTLLVKTPLAKSKEVVSKSTTVARPEQQGEEQVEEEPKQKDNIDETPMRTRSGAMLEKTPATKSKRTRGKKDGAKKKAATIPSPEKVAEEKEEAGTEKHLRTERKLSESFEESEKKGDFASKQIDLEPQHKVSKSETPSERIVTADPTEQEDNEKKITSDEKKDDMMIVDEEVKDSKSSVMVGEHKIDGNKQDKDCMKHASEQDDVHMTAAQPVQENLTEASMVPSQEDGTVQMKSDNLESSALNADCNPDKASGEKMVKITVASQSQVSLPSQDRITVNKSEGMYAESRKESEQRSKKLDAQQSHKTEEVEENKTLMDVDATTSVPLVKVKADEGVSIPRAKFIINSAELYHSTEKEFTLVIKSTKEKDAVRPTNAEPEPAVQGTDEYTGEVKPVSAEIAATPEQVETKDNPKSIRERSDENEQTPLQRVNAEKEVTEDQQFFSPFIRFQRRSSLNSTPRELRSSAVAQPIEVSPKTSSFQVPETENVQPSEEPQTKNDSMEVDTEMPSPPAVSEPSKNDPLAASVGTPSASPIGQEAFQANIDSSQVVQTTSIKIVTAEVTPPKSSPGSSIANTEKVNLTRSPAQAKVIIPDDLQTSKENPIHTPIQPDTPGSRSLRAVENRQETYIRLADNNVAFQFTNPSEEIPFSESPLPSPKLAIASTSMTVEERMETNFQTVVDPVLNNDKNIEDAEMSISPNKNDEQVTADAFDPPPPIDDNLAIDDNGGEPILGEETGGQESDDFQRYLVSDADQERVETDRLVSMPEQHSSANADDTARSADAEERSSEEERQPLIPIHPEIAGPEHADEENIIHMNIESQGEAEDSLSSSDSRSLIETPPSLPNREIETEESPRSGESAEPAHSSGLSSIGDRPDDDVGNQVRAEDTNADEVDQEDESYAQVNMIEAPIASISADGSNMEASEHEGTEWQSPSSLRDDAERTDNPVPDTNSPGVEGLNTVNANLQDRQTQPEIGHGLTPQTSPRERRNVDRLRSTELVEPQPTTNEVTAELVTASGHLSRNQPSPPRKTLTNRFLSDDIRRLEEVTANKPTTTSLLRNASNSIRELGGTLGGHGRLHSSTGIFRSGFLGRSSEVGQEITTAQNTRAASEIGDEEKPVNKRYSFNRLTGDGQPPSKRQKVTDPSMSEDRIAVGRAKRPADELLQASDGRDPKRRCLSNQKTSFDMMPTPARTLQALLPKIAGIVSISDKRQQTMSFRKENEHGTSKGSILARLEEIEAENAPKKYCAFGKLESISSKPSKAASSPNKYGNVFNMGTTPLRHRQALRPTLRTNLGTGRKGNTWDPKALAEESVKKAKELALRYQEQ